MYTDIKQIIQIVIRSMAEITEKTLNTETDF